MGQADERQAVPLPVPGVHALWSMHPDLLEHLMRTYLDLDPNLLRPQPTERHLEHARASRDFRAARPSLRMRLRRGV